MAEDKTNKLLVKIEKLILDGNNAVLGRLDKLEDGQKSVLVRLDKLEDGQKKLEDGQNKIVETLRKEIKQSYDFTSYDLGEAEKRLSDKIDKVDKKLDAHLRVPHAA